MKCIELRKGGNLECFGSVAEVLPSTAPLGRHQVLEVKIKILDAPVHICFVFFLYVYFSRMDGELVVDLAGLVLLQCGWSVPV